MVGVRGAWPCLVQNPIEAATNPFPNLSLVSMGQDVDVRLQGAGFDDHFVPGVVGGGVGRRGQTQPVSLARVGPDHMHWAISFGAAGLRESHGLNGLLLGCKANTT